MHSMTGRDTGTVLDLGRDIADTKSLLYNCLRYPVSGMFGTCSLGGCRDFASSAKDLP